MLDDEVSLLDLKKKWDCFKRARTYNSHLDPNCSDFITVLEREQIIDMLFDYILTQDIDGLHD